MVLSICPLCTCTPIQIVRPVVKAVSQNTEKSEGAMQSNFFPKGWRHLYTVIIWCLIPMTLGRNATTLPTASLENSESKRLRLTITLLHVLGIKTVTGLGGKQVMIQKWFSLPDHQLDWIIHQSRFSITNYQDVERQDLKDEVWIMRKLWKQVKAADKAYKNIVVVLS